MGRVVTITDNVLTFQAGDQRTVREMALDSVLYIHNGAGKLFFVSKRLETFFEKARGRGGLLETVDGRRMTFSRLKPEIFMYNPRVIIDQDQAIPLERIHRIVVDRSLSEFAVRKGFYVGMGVSLLRFLVRFQSIRQLGRAPAYAIEVYPGMVTLTPLATLGWVVYDFFYGDRELVINSL